MISSPPKVDHDFGMLAFDINGASNLSRGSERAGGVSHISAWVGDLFWTFLSHGNDGAGRLAHGGSGADRLSHVGGGAAGLPLWW